MIYIVGKLWILALIWHRAIEIWRILLAVRILVTRPDCFVRMIRFFVLGIFFCSPDPPSENLSCHRRKIVNILQSYSFRKKVFDILLLPSALGLCSFSCLRFNVIVNKCVKEGRRQEVIWQTFPTSATVDVTLPWNMFVINIVTVRLTFINFSQLGNTSFRFSLRLQRLLLFHHQNS